MSVAAGDYCQETGNSHKAPGTYNPENVNSDREPQYSLPGTEMQEEPHINPGPRSAPQYKLTGNGMPEKANDNPGPADYHPENINNLEHKPYVSYGNRKYVHKPTDIPSDGGD